MHVHLDAVGGVAGDMFVAALLGARPDLVDGTLAAIRAAGLPAAWSAALSDHHDHGVAGHRFLVARKRAGAAGTPARTFTDFRRLIAESALAAGVKRRAVAIFRLLAEAEGAVHGKRPADVTFHEIADWDSLADIVGAAYAIEALGAARWSVSALPLGSGRIDTAHGALPVPAPATAELLRGFEVIDDGIAGERVTPTGAAILKHLDPGRRGPARPARLVAAGTGFGSRHLPGVPNVLRVLVFEEAAPAGEAPAETVAVIRFEIDDQSPEDLAVGLENLRARADVLDVMQMAAFGKKSRMMTSIQVLCRPDSVGDVAAACFAETTTIGLRWQRAERVVLERRERRAGEVRVKVVERPGGRATAKAEADDVSGAAGGRKGRERARRTAVGRALKKKGRTRKR